MKVYLVFSWIADGDTTLVSAHSTRISAEAAIEVLIAEDSENIYRKDANIWSAYYVVPKGHYSWALPGTYIFDGHGFELITAEVDE